MVGAEVIVMMSLVGVTSVSTDVIWVSSVWYGEGSSIDS